MSEESSGEHVEILVIGGGPAGLSVAQQLARRGQPTTVLEAGETPGWSWGRMSDGLRLLSPWKVNSLPGSPASLKSRHRLFSGREFYAYLKAYAQRFKLDVRCNAPVQSVDALPSGGFYVQTIDGSIYRATYVINATGYYSKPFTPSWPGLESSQIRTMHAVDYKSPQQVAEQLGRRDARLLIVGARVTGGQLVTELHDDPETNFQVEISSRAPIEFARPLWVQQIAFWGFYIYEDLKVLLDPSGTPDSYPPMQGGRARRLIERGDVPSRPDIQRFQTDSITFLDGSSHAYDLVLLATGYRPAIDHLGELVSREPRSGLPPIKDMESPEAPGLYFLGLDQQRSFRSRYLRGIREDARLLAKRLDAKIAAGSPLGGNRYASPFAEAQESIERVGLLATTQLVASRLYDRWYDRKHGLDTSDRVTLDKLEVDPEAAAQGQMYQPSGVLGFRRIFQRINLPDAPVFVDYGSGKGRTLFLAAELPNMKRVVGIEFSHQLCEVAQRNQVAFAARKPAGAPIDVICIDATAYEYQDDENIFYFFYPFGQKLMERVLEGIEASLARRPRPAILVYFYPIHRNVIDRSSAFELEDQFHVFGSACLVYRHHPTHPTPVAEPS